MEYETKCVREADQLLSQQQQLQKTTETKLAQQQTTIQKQTTHLQQCLKQLKDSQRALADALMISQQLNQQLQECTAMQASLQLQRKEHEDEIQRQSAGAADLKKIIPDLAVHAAQGT